MSTCSIFSCWRRETVSVASESEEFDELPRINTSTDRDAANNFKTSWAQRAGAWIWRNKGALLAIVVGLALVAAAIILPGTIVAVPVFFLTEVAAAVPQFTLACTLTGGLLVGGGVTSAYIDRGAPPKPEPEPDSV